MTKYKIHPIVKGVKVFDKSMMTCPSNGNDTIINVNEVYQVLKQTKGKADIILPPIRISPCK
ncbi:MAG: hypothetical protein HOD92_02030 [Deltaproteobacteria bacterium]|jgi:hypothetical protein|nr:hypothetical protein [Deltaproteobacteria bacterium]MBT4526985.1 hypothetical protein [Deltaproteobacteria bacterium]